MSPEQSPAGARAARRRAITAAIGGAAVVVVVVVAIAARRGCDPPNAADEMPGRDGPPAAPPAATATVAATAAAASEPEIAPAPDEISVLALLGEMADLAHLARLPAAPFVARQASSYDRRSRAPGDGDSWFANDDFITNTEANLVRVETTADGGKRYVLLDAAGPGAVVRIWTATPAGTLRIFIDGDARPALEAPMGALLGGTSPPFVPPLGQVTAMGYNLYFPFPYRERCLITIDSIVSTDPFSGHPMDKVYYQIGYRTYGAAARAHVRPYTSAELDRARPTIPRVAAALDARAPRAMPTPAVGPPSDAATPATATPATATATALPATATIGAVAIAKTAVTAASPSVTIVPAPPGGAVITALHLTTPERDRARLRATTLSITFDGEETVRAPLGDFFGTGPGINPYASLPMTVTADGALTCRFPMPFHHKAVVTIARDEGAAGGSVGGAVEVEGGLVVQPAPFDDDALLFHARFRGPDQVATRPIRDWHVGTLGGHGRQIGTVLSVENPPGVSWWGEGDEKIFVDGEAFPALFGTGTEDYFGYAWSSTETFAHPYHAQTLSPGQGFAGWFSMNRFLVLDPVPFENTLRFDLEVWHWSETVITLSAVLYWYARPGATDDFPR